MAAEHDKHMVHKDLEAKEEEMEQLRYNMQKKASLQFCQFVLFCILYFLKEVGRSGTAICMFVFTYRTYH